MPSVVVSDDFRLAWREQGSGPPVLLVHGWAAHGGFFQPQLDGLSGDFRVIAPDLRGHGRSRADGDLTVARLAEDLAGLLAALDLTEVTAVGWSMGAMVLWDLALGPQGSRLSRLVVEDMSPRIVNEPGWALGMRGGYDLSASEESVRMMRADWPSYAASLARFMFAEETDSEALAAFAQREFTDQSPEPLASLWRDLASRDDRARLPRVDVETLVIEGRHGPYPADTARFIADAMPHARRVEFARSGHAPHLEEPGLFNRTIANFASRPAASPIAGAART